MKTIFIGLAFACSILAMCTSVVWAIDTSENPKLDHAQLNVSPLIQGVDGPLTIETSVQLNGTC